MKIKSVYPKVPYKFEFLISAFYCSCPLLLLSNQCLSVLLFVKCPVVHDSALTISVPLCAPMFVERPPCHPSHTTHCLQLSPGLITVLGAYQYNVDKYWRLSAGIVDSVSEGMSCCDNVQSYWFYNLSTLGTRDRT